MKETDINLNFHAICFNLFFYVSKKELLKEWTPKYRGCVPAHPLHFQLAGPCAAVYMPEIKQLRYYPIKRNIDTGQ